MADKWEKNLNETIEKYESQLDEINNATTLTQSLADSIFAKSKDSIAKANKSTSIDERIQILVQALNELVEFAATKAKDTKRQVDDLKLQISTLEDQLSLAVPEEPVPESENAPDDSDDVAEEEKKN